MIIILLLLVLIAATVCLVFGYMAGKKRSRTIDTLYGEVIDIRTDVVSGLSVITVKDNKNQTCYGMSKMSVHELEILYMGKGYVQIPIIPQTK